MALLESGENYLETILVLSKHNKELHAIDIVNHLGYSKPSVSIMLKKLKEADYISIDTNNHISLTEKGYEIANKIYERHSLLTTFLINLGVDEQTAEDDACKIEHYLSEQTIDAIKNSLTK